ncbi:MAG: hypothetical protein CMQ77_03270 [Gammaproteobacteria bacterium]|nr:hypothetical protein [Gammaproteobacteria bacterium]
MDSYYPILSGCLHENEKQSYINKTFADFYIKDIGIKCVVDEPWVTVAETCEFIISLMISEKKKESKKTINRYFKYF